MPPQQVVSSGLSVGGGYQPPPTCGVQVCGCCPFTLFFRIRCRVSFLCSWCFGLHRPACGAGAHVRCGSVALWSPREVNLAILALKNRFAKLNMMLFCLPKRLDRDYIRCMIICFWSSKAMKKNDWWSRLEWWLSRPLAAKHDSSVFVIPKDGTSRCTFRLFVFFCKSPAGALDRAWK